MWLMLALAGFHTSPATQVKIFAPPASISRWGRLYTPESQTWTVAPNGSRMM